MKDKEENQKRIRVLHFQPFAGLSGDMVLAALLDLGVNQKEFKEAMEHLGLGIKIKISQVERANLRSLRVEVILPEKKKIKERKWSEIQNLIKATPFSFQVKERAELIFRLLFQAESRVHGCRLQKIHLHEAGADDALVDIIGSCWLLEKLQVDKITCAPINLGSGWVKTDHGLLPVPPPAVSEILRNVPVYSFGPPVELTTPTGAAIIACLADSFVAFPEITVNRVGYGAGFRDFPDFPNLLRVFLGEVNNKNVSPLYEINTNIDDTTPQVLAYTSEKLLKAGALDVFQTPVVMKKGRLATQLTVLVPADKMDKVIEILFKETTTIGLRYHPVERQVLERKIETVEVEGKRIPVKIAFYGNRVVQIQPEYDCLSELAEEKAIPLKEIQQKARDLWKKKQRGLKDNEKS